MTREEAIYEIKQLAVLSTDKEIPKITEALNMAIEALKADVARWSSWNKTFEQSGIADLISRADAIEAVRVCDVFLAYQGDKIANNIDVFVDSIVEQMRDNISRAVSALPSADRPTGWITDRKPNEHGSYMVTLKSLGSDYVTTMYFGKPIMPNIEVNGMCWYRSDDEWGDVVYDDKDVIAWQPLPTPYTKK